MDIFWKTVYLITIVSRYGASFDASGVSTWVVASGGETCDWGRVYATSAHCLNRLMSMKCIFCFLLVVSKAVSPTRCIR